jgi:hypothetical protein
MLQVFGCGKGASRWPKTGTTDLEAADQVDWFRAGWGARTGLGDEVSETSACRGNGRFRVQVVYQRSPRNKENENGKVSGGKRVGN